MRLRNYLKNLNQLPLLLVLSSSVLLSGCSSFGFGFGGPEEKVITQIETIERKIPLQGRPKGLTLYDVYFYAVTEENYEEFKEKFLKDNPDLVYFAISIPGYENLALGMADMKRYIEQQKAIIVYYENAITGKKEEEPKKEEGGEAK